MGEIQTERQTDGETDRQTDRFALSLTDSDFWVTFDVKKVS